MCDEDDSGRPELLVDELLHESVGFCVDAERMRRTQRSVDILDQEDGNEEWNGEFMSSEDMRQSQRDCSPASKLVKNNDLTRSE